MQLYIHRDGQQYGPYSIEQAREYLAGGSLQAEDLAWHEGAAEWIPLTEVEGIAPVAAQAVPVPAQAAESSWIPPKRTGNSSPTAVASTQISSSASTNKVSAVPVQAASVVTLGKTAKSSRKSSSNKNPITQRQRSIGARNMGFGALWCVGGLAVTIFSYEAASETPGGGHYFLAWGAVLFGGIQFVKGLIQFCKA